MRFLRAAREDQALAARLRALDPEDGLPGVVDVAAEAGFEFAADDLRTAHAYDWALRRMAYANVPSAASTVAVVNSASSST
jgi:predicted ribosomally synthesized peptide with nif11-like leader